jgi:hypothetical protein
MKRAATTLNHGLLLVTCVTARSSDDVGDNSIEARSTDDSAAAIDHTFSVDSERRGLQVVGGPAWGSVAWDHLMESGRAGAAQLPDSYSYSYEGYPLPPPPIPPPPPSPPPPPPPVKIVLCSNSCPQAPKFASDTFCDDGGPDSLFNKCILPCALMASHHLHHF